MDSNTLTIRTLLSQAN